MTTEDGPPVRSVHGGELGVADRVLRGELAGRLFGREQPVNVGRFRVRRLLGAGGMGRVFLAEDPELQRDVAIKIVHQMRGLDQERARTRMQSEARAQAKLSDPNVVTVYEVGSFDGGLFIAMEYVEGTTLRHWLDDESRDWREIVDKFLQAGRGLAAAHRRGLVHRDFKPDNVLLDAEHGRARVTDFGLVRPPSTTDPALEDDATPGTTRRAGTPGYMSPEQRDGTAVDARSDQYAYCVAFKEALAGQRVPPHLHRILDRGLEPAPADRWQDMPRLLSAVQRCVAPRRTLIAISAAAIATLGIVAIWPSGPDCEDAGDLTGVWDDAQREGATAAAREAELAHAAAAWPAAREMLDDYARTWAHEREQACTLQDTRPSDFAARSLDCLETRRSDFARLTSDLVAREPGAVAGAVRLVTRLSDPRLCNDERRLSRWVVPADPQSLAQREEARAKLWTAVVAGASSAGDSDQAAAAAQRAERIADNLGDAATQAQALGVLGQLAMQEGRLAEAEQLLERGVSRADAAGDDRVRARLLISLVYVIGTDIERLGEALQAADQADAALQAIGDPPILRAHLLGNTGTVKAKARAEDPIGAITDHREAIALLTETVGEDHPDVLSARVNLGNALSRAGRNDDSRRELEAVARSAPAIWGPKHPNTARVEGMVGMALLRAKDLEGARERLSHALEIAEGTLGPEHDQVADARFNLAIALRRLGHFDLAAQQLRRGLSAREAVRGKKHPSLIAWLLALGRAELGQEHRDAAAQSLQRALELCEHDGATAADFARVRFALAKALVESDADRSRVLAERAGATYRELGRAKKTAQVEAFLKN